MALAHFISEIVGDHEYFVLLLVPEIGLLFYRVLGSRAVVTLHLFVCINCDLLIRVRYCFFSVSLWLKAGNFHFPPWLAGTFPPAHTISVAERPAATSEYQQPGSLLHTDRCYAMWCHCCSLQKTKTADMQKDGGTAGFVARRIRYRSYSSYVTLSGLSGHNLHDSTCFDTLAGLSPSQKIQQIWEASSG